MEGKSIVSIKKELVEICKLMDQKGFVNAYDGNLSVKQDNLIYITPSGKSKLTLTQDMIAVIDENGNQIEGDYKPSSELTMHTNAYKVRDSIGAVIHAHSPYLTAHAICNKPVESKAFCEMIAIFKKINVAPYGRPGTEKIFKHVPEFLKTENIVLLANHGVLAVGKDIESAFNTIEVAETITKTLTIAKSIGTEDDLDKDEYDFLYDFKL
jgi:L-fuculose-phosphate aldolase